jgi:hypothetical protein
MAAAPSIATAMSAIAIGYGRRSAAGSPAGTTSTRSAWGRALATGVGTS